MTESETRVLGRTAAVLLAVSLIRFGWEARQARSDPVGGGRDDGPTLLAESRRLAAETQARSRPLAAQERVDPNRAGAVELDRLPGVGPAAARAIVAARDSGGAFASPEDLLSVPGIGPGTLDRMRSHLDLGTPPPPGVRRRRPAGGRPGAGPLAAGPSVGGRPPGPSSPGRPAPAPRPPLDLNRATAEELERLPGVGPALAARILEQRARVGRFGSADDLLKVRGIGPKTLDRLRPLLAVGGG